jgi:hypothetical protein
MYNKYLLLFWFSNWYKMILRHTLWVWLFLLVGGSQVLAQKNLQPASQSTLTGIELPEGTKLDKRMLVRAAAKTLMDMEAKELGVTLGSGFEIFLLPGNSNATAASFIVKGAEANGWKLGLTKSLNKWGWMEKDGRQMIIHVETENKENYLYLAEVNGKLQKADSIPVAITKELPATIGANPETPADQNRNPAPPKDENRNFSGNFQFSTTQFDDGWTAIAEMEWVKLNKGSLTVLLHFANEKIEMGEGQTPVLNANAWDVLVAPRYASKADYYAFNGTISYLRSSATVANLTDAAGKTYYVVMFRRGGGPFMEFICPDKASFVKEFGVDISEANERELVWSDDDLWLKMDNMQYRNRFAVAITDLPGYWTSSSFAGVQMYYVSTGNYAGMNATAIAAEFWLEKDGSYRSQHKGASGMVGNQQIFQQEYKGRFSMNGPWEITFSNRFNGKTDIYGCEFQVVRGGRILSLTNKAANGDKYQLGRQN